MDKINKMKIEELEATIKRAQEQIEELEVTINRAQEQIEELKQEENTPKFIYPNVTDMLWFITASGEIQRYRWDGALTDKVRFRQGNLFYTYEEAQNERERRFVIMQLKLFAEPKDKVWDKSKPHYYIEYNYTNKIVEYDYIYTYRHNDIYFASKEDCQKAVDFVGAYKVAKYFLGIEE